MFGDNTPLNTKQLRNLFLCQPNGVFLNSNFNAFFGVVWLVDNDLLVIAKCHTHLLGYMIVA